MKFWDSSALVPLLVRQPATQAMQELAARDPVMHVWWGTRVECVSAISRLERLERRIDLDQTVVALGRLKGMSNGWMEVEPSDNLRELAQRFLRVHDLRTGDAFQLAAASLCGEQYPGSVEFVCLDERLNRAALREGFQVVRGAS